MLVCRHLPLRVDQLVGLPEVDMARQQFDPLEFVGSALTRFFDAADRRYLVVAGQAGTQRMSQCFIGIFLQSNPEVFMVLEQGCQVARVAFGV